MEKLLNSENLAIVILTIAWIYEQMKNKTLMDLLINYFKDHTEKEDGNDANGTT